MSRLAQPIYRWPILTLLWGLVGAAVWLTGVQLLLVAMNPFCHLKTPAVIHVEVVGVDPNPDSQLTDWVNVKQGQRERTLCMAKAEAAALHPEDEVFVLETWYADGLRPTEFRLGLLRLLLEYPLLILLPLGLGLWRMHLIKAEAAAAPLPPVRRTFTDDFHLRAQRFGEPSAPPKPPADPESH
jgi:hypothetical protein